MTRNIKVAYICVHNSCRSQMAEAISKLIAEDYFEAYSAGTETNKTSLSVWMGFYFQRVFKV